MDGIERRFNGSNREDNGTSGTSGTSRFSDAKQDALMEARAVETEPIARQSQIRAALSRHQDQLYQLALYRQTLARAVREGVDAQPAANKHRRVWLLKLAP